MKYKLARLNDANSDLSRQWFVYYYFQHPETGKMKRFRKWISLRLKTKVSRYEKAKFLIKDVNNRLLRGWNPYSENEIRLTNLVSALEFALKIKEATIKKRGSYTYRSIVRIFLRYLHEKHLDIISIEEMSSKIARDYCDYMLIDENISLRTYNNRITGLKTLFNVLLEREYIIFNPFNRIKKQQTPDPEITAYLPDELLKINDSLPSYNYQLYAITQLIFYCFLRPAEIVRLQFRDILWDHDLIVMPGTKTKNKKSQVIIIPTHMKENLKDWSHEFPDDYYIFSRHLNPGTKEIAPTRIAEAWRRYADKHNIKKGIYDFKHTGNGFAFDQGFNARDIQLQNRHSSLDETQKYLNKFRRIASDKFKNDFQGY